MKEWTQDEIDDAVIDDDPDVCHHGVGFDENCEWCELEIAEEREAAREAQRAQGDLFKSRV